ncbi:hypothetical protein [Actinomadura chokoriensis]|uniref:Uncharacterized protein n=1 Tax=Actinomadura chokoriensis TaxID=454156 RepID=A0ABV4R8F1_9ACTN
MHTTADRAPLLQGIESIRTLAELADPTAIARLLDQPAAISHLDDHTLDFLRRAQDLLLATTRTLTGALEPTRRPTTIDIAEAWHRALLHLPRRDDGPVLIHIQEFEDAYQAIPILVPIPEPPPVPTLETATTLVIDKTTGTVTRWPLLPLDVLTSQYRRYKHQEPMLLDNQPS